MFHDLRIYAFLRMRLNARAFSRALAGFLASDLSEDRDLESRLYQIYTLLFIIITLVLLWFAMLYYAEIAFLFL